MKRPVKPKVFQYKTRRKAAPPLRRPVRKDEPETFTGIVKGQPASDLEERLARALMARKIEFLFQVPVYTAYSVPGQENIVDFVVYYDIPQPLEVDGEYAHKSAGQKEKDRMRDALIDEALQLMGFQLIKRIAGDKLLTQQMALDLVDDLF